MKNSNILKVVLIVFVLVSCTRKIDDANKLYSLSDLSNYKLVGLPFESGGSFRISQGAFGNRTHNEPGNEYNWDLAVPFGTKVLAVESGKVIKVWQPNKGGGCDPKFSQDAHNIKIEHKDGTVAQYVHIKSSVKEGDIMKKGAKIGVTAKNGFICTPHLHFGVYRSKDHLYQSNVRETLPLRFEGIAGGLLVEGREYMVPKMRPATIIFLHGALLGGWIWKDVGVAFENSGHEVFAPDLPGRDGVGSPGITLGSYVEAISKLVNKSSYPVFLVAHSMSGIVASQVAENHSEKVNKVVYVSAYVPKEGQSLKDVYEEHFGPLVYDKDSMSIKLGLQLTAEDLINASFHDCADDIKEQVRKYAVSEPIQPSLDVLKLTEGKFGSIPKAYIRLKNDKVVPPELQNKMIELHGISEVYELETGHAPFCADPQGFVATIKEVLG